MSPATKETDDISPASREEQTSVANPNELNSTNLDYEIDPVVEARVVRKLDHRVLVLMGTLCMFG